MWQRQPEVLYRIDSEDLLVGFNPQWDTFAEENGSPGLLGGRIRGQSLWDFIHDPETRHLHATLLTRVRANGEIRNLPFRCDAPALRRFMEMDITALADGQVEYRCRTIKTESRDPVPLLADKPSPTGVLLRMCSWCKKLDAGNDSWLEVEESVKALGLFDKASMPPISHTLCDSCWERVIDDT